MNNIIKRKEDTIKGVKVMLIVTKEEDGYNIEGFEVESHNVFLNEWVYMDEFENDKEAKFYATQLFNDSLVWIKEKSTVSAH